MAAARAPRSSHHLGALEGREELSPTALVRVVRKGHRGIVLGCSATELACADTSSASEMIGMTQPWCLSGQRYPEFFHGADEEVGLGPARSVEEFAGVMEESEVSSVDLDEFLVTRHGIERGTRHLRV